MKLFSSLFWQPRITKYRDGLIVCDRCEGYGAIDIGLSLPLGCHRCYNGLTTKSFQKAARDWEQNCYDKLTTSRRAQLSEAYTDARLGRDLLLHPRWYEKL